MCGREEWSPRGFPSLTYIDRTICALLIGCLVCDILLPLPAGGESGAAVSFTVWTLSSSRGAAQLSKSKLSFFFHEVKSKSCAQYMQEDFLFFFHTGVVSVFTVPLTQLQIGPLFLIYDQAHFCFLQYMRVCQYRLSSAVYLRSFTWWRGPTPLKRVVLTVVPCICLFNRYFSNSKSRIVFFTLVFICLHPESYIPLHWTKVIDFIHCIFFTTLHSLGLYPLHWLFAIFESRIVSAYTGPLSRDAQVC